MPPLEDVPMLPEIEDGLDPKQAEMELDGIDLQSIIDVVQRQYMQSIPCRTCPMISNIPSQKKKVSTWIFSGHKS